MIKRLNKATDQLDLIVCKDELFASNIKRIIYYTQGHKEEILEPDYDIQKDVIVVALSSDDIAKLPEGILMREVEYIVEDTLYLDGKRNLVMTDNMNVWIC